MRSYEKKVANIQAAIKEAAKFIECAHAWKARLRHYSIASKEGGACKRSSLDLTRALAEMRK